MSNWAKSTARGPQEKPAFVAVIVIFNSQLCLDPISCHHQRRHLLLQQRQHASASADHHHRRHHCATRARNGALACDATVAGHLEQPCVATAVTRPSSSARGHAPPRGWGATPPPSTRKLRCSNTGDASAVGTVVPAERQQLALCAQVATSRSPAVAHPHRGARSSSLPTCVRSQCTPGGVARLPACAPARLAWLRRCCYALLRLSLQMLQPLLPRTRF